ncbi:uncharacterized protein TNCV_2417051 [Trichonephila clavipes]|nr:uncharacterized protein TNCV_2417051 [Trichonephila clavipes]
MMHDGDPVHFCALVRDWLDMTYSCRWLGHGSPVLYTPRSPDLTPLDFFPVENSQVIGISRRTDCTSDSVASIHAACTSVDTALLRFRDSPISRRAKACLDMYDGPFEHLYF